MSYCSESLSNQERYTHILGMLRPDYPFIQLGFHFGAKAGPTSRTTRVKRGDKYFIKKEYLGHLTNKTEHEIDLLMTTAWKGLQHSASFKTVNAMTCMQSTENENSHSKLELLMKNYGLDLEDWFFILREAQVDYTSSPYFYLALMHSILVAMKELHEANLVQVDVKPDNMCVALPKLLKTEKSGHVVLEFNLNELTLIDMGEALHPDPNKRVLLFHPSGMVLGPENDYISPHYKKVKAEVKHNEMKPLRSLDWRIDFYPLGCMLEEWLMLAQFSASPPEYLTEQEKRHYGEAIRFLSGLPARLKAEDTDPASGKAKLPHDDIIQEIGKRVNLKKWLAMEFSLPVSLTASRVLAAAANDFSSQSPLRAETLLVENAGLSPVRSATARHDLQALSWYLRASQQVSRPRSGIDLMC